MNSPVSESDSRSLKETSIQFFSKLCEKKITLKRGRRKNQTGEVFFSVWLVIFVMSSCMVLVQVGGTHK